MAMSGAQQGRPRVVAIFGAGASAASGGLILNQVMAEAFKLADDGHVAPWNHTVREFLQSVFCVRFDEFGEYRRNLPDIGLILSMVDLAVRRRRGFPSSAGAPKGAKAFWPHHELVKLREHLDGMIAQAVRSGYLSQFDVWEGTNASPAKILKAFSHEIFLDFLYDRDPGFELISLNYDMFLERAACQHLALLGTDDFRPEDYFPRYNVDFERPYHELRPARPVHKLHGSLDWAVCPGCGRVYLMFTKEYWENSARTQAPDVTEKETRLDVDQFYTRLMDPNESDLCGWETCQTPLRPMIVAPTLVKEYEDKHLEHVWRHAEKGLRCATEVYIVGYSLPPDDIAFMSLLKRSTQQVHPKNIHVIVPDAAAIQRYHSIFGPEVDVHAKTFGQWIVEHREQIPTIDRYGHYRAAREEALDRLRPNLADPETNASRCSRSELDRPEARTPNDDRD